MTLGARLIGSTTFGDGTGFSGSASILTTPSLISATGATQTPTLVSVATPSTIDSTLTIETATIVGASVAISPSTIQATLTVQSVGAGEIVPMSWLTGADFQSYSGVFVEALHPIVPLSGSSTYDTLILGDSPVGYWPLRSSTAASAGPSPTTDRFSNRGHTRGPRGFGNATTFSSDYLIISSSVLDLNVSTFSFEAWVQHVGGTGKIETIMRSGEANLQVATNGNWEFSFIDTGSTTRTVSANPSSVPMNDGNWHHVVGTYDGFTQRIYVDADQRASTAVAVDVLWSAITTTIGGLQGGTQFFQGSLCGVATYNIALTGEQVREHYLEGIRDLSDTGDDVTDTIFYPTLPGEDRAGFTPITAQLDTSYQPNVDVTTTTTSSLFFDFAKLDDDTVVSAKYTTSTDLTLKLITFDVNDAASFLTDHTFAYSALSSSVSTAAFAYPFRISNTEIGVMWQKNSTTTVISFFSITVGTDTVNYTSGVEFTQPTGAFSSLYGQPSHVCVMDENTILLVYGTTSSTAKSYAYLVYRDTAQATPMWTGYGRFEITPNEATRQPYNITVHQVDANVAVVALWQYFTTDNATNLNDLAISIVTLYVDREYHVVSPIHSLSRQLSFADRIVDGVDIFADYSQLVQLDSGDYLFEISAAPGDYYPTFNVTNAKIVFSVNENYSLTVVRGTEASDEFETSYRAAARIGGRNVVEIVDNQTLAGAYLEGTLNRRVLTFRSDGSYREWSNLPIAISGHDYAFFYEPIELDGRSVVVAERDTGNFTAEETVMIVVRDLNA